MKRALTMVFLALLAACPLTAQAPSRWSWSPAQKTGAMAMAATVAMDCGTTQLGLTHYYMRELNPVLGSHPSVSRLWATCALGTAATLTVAHLVGRKHRGWVLGAVWAVETVVVAWNLNTIAHAQHR